MKGHAAVLRPAPEDPRGLLRVPPGGADLASHDPRATPGLPRDKAYGVAATRALAGELAGLQDRLFAASTAGDRRRLLLVLQGMDTSGKGGAVKRLAAGLNPAGCRVRAFKAPTARERRGHFLDRVRAALPAPGEIGVFDRSHYEDVLVARVRGLVPQEVWEGRYAEINAFEQELADDGVTLVKVFLHISYERQRERLLARLDNPDKHWKFSVGDIEDRALWPDYQRAYEAVLDRCNTGPAPWYLVPADRKWYRDWAVSHLLHAHLATLDPRYPPGDFDPVACRARLAAT